jgi:hypothetical protein
LAFAVVILPLFIFLFSVFLTPEAKSECKHGWLDCFIMGKLALLPLALYATVALYTVEVLRVPDRAKTWIVLGLWSGAFIACVCSVYGFACLRDQSLASWLLVPLYVAVWYTIRAVQLTQERNRGHRIIWQSLLGSLPFWLGSILLARSTYESLPVRETGCFIVTAAGRGHRRFVGPFFEIHRRGRKIQANQQLITLWQLEYRWQRLSPRSHAGFRRVYNWIGPVIARQIRSPWLADLTYLAIKPVELVAALIIQPRPERGSDCQAEVRPRSNVAGTTVHDQI